MHVSFTRHIEQKIQRYNKSKMKKKTDVRVKIIDSRWKTEQEENNMYATLKTYFSRIYFFFYCCFCIKDKRQKMVFSLFSILKKIIHM